MKIEYINIKIDKKGFIEYCKYLKKTKEGQALIQKWIKEGIIKEARK
jgi:hypothetical protein